MSVRCPMKRNILTITITIIAAIAVVIFSFAGCGGGGGGGAGGGGGEDTTAPAGYSVSFDQAAVNASNEAAVSFTFAAAEVGATYDYSIDDTNGGTAAVTGTGTIATATDTIAGIDVSSLDDDTLTLTVYLTDDASNQGADVTDTVTKDTVTPTGYSVAIDQALVNSGNETAVSFTFAAAEVGATYNYSIDDTNGGTAAVTGSGTTVSATDNIAGIDVSSLDDDTLTLTVYLTDAAGNQGANTTDTVTKEATPPSGYSATFDQDPIIPANETAVSFTFAAAEIGATYNYSIDDDNGGTSAVTGSGTIVTATDTIAGIDVSSLDDDLDLTLTVYLTDTSGNQGANATDTAVKDTTAPSGYSVSIDQSIVNPGNETAVSFTFAAAEVGATYDYSIDDTNGGTAAVTGNGTIVTATDNITGIDVSTLDDDTLTLTVYLTDTAGNQGGNVTDTVTKDTTAPTISMISPPDNDGATAINSNLVLTFDEPVVLGTGTVVIYDNVPSAYDTIDVVTDVARISGSGTTTITIDRSAQGNFGTTADYHVEIAATAFDDTAGNSYAGIADAVTWNFTTGAAADVTAPAGYSVLFDQAFVFSGNETAISFTFAAAEVGTTYYYSIDDTNGGTAAVTGSGTIATGTDTISGIDVSSLDDDTLTLTVYLVDAAGNQGADANDTIAKDSTPPSGYSVTIDQASINPGNENALSFTFAGAEVGATYDYSIDDEIIGGPVTGNGVIATATDQITAIDVSGLNDGTLTLTVYLTDTSGNQGADETDTVVKDTTPPAGYSVSFDQASANSNNETAMSFTFAAAEVGATYDYSIDDTNGGTAAVTGNGTIVTATDNIAGIDVSTLDDDTLTLTVYLTDGEGNQGGDVTDSLTKDTVAPSGYSVSIDQPTVYTGNETAISFTFAAAEVGADYDYSVDDTNGGTAAVTGSGTIATGTDQITGIDVSSLDDDTLTFTVYLTDPAGNQGADTTDTVTKDTAAPVGYSVSIDQATINSGNETAVSFTFAAAEVGANYNYSIDDANAGTAAVEGFGVIATATDTISGLDVSGLDDGTLTLTAYLTNAAGNQGADATDTVVKDTAPPAGYSVSIDQAFVNSGNEAAVSFTFAAAEVGADYDYSIDDTNGGTVAVTGSGTIATATDTISGIDVSSLDDDTLTLTVYLTDTEGYQGGDVTDTVVKEATAPVINTTTPADEDGSVLLNATLLINFNEPVITGTGYVKIYDTADTVTPAYSIDVNGAQVTGSGSATITVDPSTMGNFNDSTNYYVQIDATAFDDINGNSFAGIADDTTWNFQTTAVTTDTTNPTVFSFSPINNALNISPNTNLVITFDEPVIVGTGNIEILDNSGTPGVLGDDVSFESIDVTSAKVTGSGTTTITIDPAGTLADLTGYYVLIDATAFDDAPGNSYDGIVADDSVWTFTTDDTTAPAVQTLVAADDAVDVLPSADLVITFDESVVAGTGNISIYDSTDTLFESFDVTTDVTGLPGTSITINPTTDLADLTDYYVQISAGVVEDGRGNTFAGIADETTWNFSTADVTAPSVAALLPADDATGVLLNRALIITFDEAVTLGTGNISIYTPGPTLVEAIDVVADAAQITGDGTSTLVITPSAPFAGSTDHYVQIDATAIDDLATTPNDFAGIGDSTTWNFQTTASATDSTNPSVSPPFSPANNAINVSPDSNLVITFDEPVVIVTGNIEILDNSGTVGVLGDDVSFEVIDVVADADKLSGSGTATITIDPAGTLADETGYYVLIAATAFEDASGNAYAGIVGDDSVWTFTTDDTTAPAISTLVAADDATDVLPSANLSITFDEAVVAGTGNIKIFDSTDTLFETFDVVADAGTKVTGAGTATITIDPTTDLADLTDYYVQIDSGAFEDGRSNGFAGIADETTWNFRTADVTAPSIASLLPADNSIGVFLNRTLIITFDETVSLGTGNISIYTTGPTLVEEIDVVADAAQITGDGTSTLVVTPTSNFTGSTDYYIQIDATAIEDNATTPNAFAGIADSTTWNFQTTGVLTDVTDPSVLTFSPANSSAGVALESNLVITFDEPVVAGSGNIEILDNSGTPGVLGDDVSFEVIDVQSAMVIGSGTTAITINPAGTFSESTDYYVLIAATAFDDTASNSYAGIVADDSVWSFTSADVTAPSVSTLSPADDAAGVTSTTNLEITFDEAVNTGTGTVRIYNSSDVLYEAVSVDSGQVTGSGTATITIDPAKDFSGPKEYYVQIDPTAFVDDGGNSYAGISDKATWNFTVVDTTPPIIISVTPADNAIDVALNSMLEMTFDKAVNVSTGNVSIYTAGPTLVEAIDVTAAGQVFGDGTDTITLIPSSGFAGSTDYYVQVDSGAFVDTTANANAFPGISGNSAWNFTTVADATGPSIFSLSPANGSTGVEITSNLVITFDEPVVAGSGSIVIYDNNGTPGVPGDDIQHDSIDMVADVSQLSGLGSSSVSIDPLTDLSTTTQYYVEIAGTAFEDTSGNAFAGITGEATWGFTTGSNALGDTTAPTVLVRAPANAATAVSTSTNLVLTFDESIAVGTGNIEIYDADAGNTLIETIGVSLGRVTGYGTPTITIDPLNDLGTNTNYYVLIDSTAFEDTSGNAFAGYSINTDWAFQTGATADTTPPTIFSHAPVDEETDVAVNTNLVITFDEVVVAGTGNIEIYDADTGPTLIETIASGLAQGYGTKTIVIDPENDLPSLSTNYYVLIDSGAIIDTSGNDFAGITADTTWNFTTAGAATPDSTPPSIASLTPANGATDVLATNANLTITFDEPVVAGSGDITIYDSGDVLRDTITIVPGQTQVSGFGTASITIDPAYTFLALEGYYVQIDAGAFKDISGNSFAGIADTTTWRFWTDTNAALDAAAPTIASVLPANNAVSVDLNSNLVIIFDEIVVMGSGDIVVLDDTAPLVNPGVEETRIGVGTGRVRGFGTKTITIDPVADPAQNNFAVSSEPYYVLIDAGALKDIAGNDFAGILELAPLDQTWGFTTGVFTDSTAPAISDYATDVSPIDGATDVAITSHLTMTFDEEVVAGSGNIVIMDTNGTPGVTGDDTVFETIASHSNRITGYGTTDITINPQADLDFNEGYYVTIESGAITDAADNDFAGITLDTTWNFTTETVGVVFTESFDYADPVGGGDLDTATPDGGTTFPWIVGVATGTTAVQYDDATGMSFTGYASAAGGSATGNEDINGGSMECTNFSADVVTDSGSIYLAFLIDKPVGNTNNADGFGVALTDGTDILGGLSFRSRNQVNRYRVMLDDEVSKTEIWTVGQLTGTHLVVMKYDFATEVLSGYVDPDLTLAEPAPTDYFTVDKPLQWPNVDRIIIDQAFSSVGTVDSTYRVDEIKVVKGWSLLQNPMGPTITSVTADDPDDGDLIYSTGDTITFVFSENTNQPFGPSPTQAELDILFGTMNLGAAYSGSWTDAQTLVITIDDATGGTAPTIGTTSFQLQPRGGLKDAAETSLSSMDISSAITGDWGL
jgi:methionine-rich copper-binding protein CopC